MRIYIYEKRWRARRNIGFTLVEILLVITIIAIMVAMVVPRLAGRSKQAKISIAEADIEASLSIALDLYELDNGMYPSSGQGLKALIEKPDITPIPNNWKGPYLKKRVMPKDPWGNPYNYAYPGVNNSDGYDLWSVGPDQSEGGDDDITNWEDE